MVTPTNGTCTFIGLASQKVYAVDLYISDVNNANCTFGVGTTAAAGSKAYWRPIEDVVLVDLSIITGPTVITTLVPTSNDAQLQGTRLRFANFLNTLTTRPRLQIGFAKGNEVGFIQQT